ncbi:hypothetical protein COOONC_00388 [Cooperia oncophora]
MASRTYPRGNVRRVRPATVTNGRGLPVQGRNWLKEIVRMSTQPRVEPLRIANLNIGDKMGRKKSRDTGEGYKLSYYGETDSKDVVIVASDELRSQISRTQRKSDIFIFAITDARHVVCMCARFDPIKIMFRNQSTVCMFQCHKEDLVIVYSNHSRTGHFFNLRAGLNV